MQGQGMQGGRKKIGWKVEIKVASPAEVDVQIYCFMQFEELSYVHEPGYDLKSQLDKKK